jgi:hypothetical protein
LKALLEEEEEGVEEPTELVKHLEEVLLEDKVLVLLVAENLVDLVEEEEEDRVVVDLLEEVEKEEEALLVVDLEEEVQEEALLVVGLGEEEEALVVAAAVVGP